MHKKYVLTLMIKKMEIKNDLLLKFWIKEKAEEYAVMILEYVYNQWRLVDDYGNFLFGFAANHLFTLDKIWKYLFYKYGEAFLYQLYLYYLSMPDAQYFRTKQNLQATEETRISSEEEGSDDSEENETTRRKKRKIS